MSAREGLIGTVALLVGIAVLLVGIGVTAWLVVRTWRRRDAASVAARVMSVVVAFGAVGALGTVIGIIKAFGAVGGESIDPSQRARILAGGISDAMNCTAVGVAVWVLSIVVTLLLIRKDKKQEDRSR